MLLPINNDFPQPYKIQQVVDVLKDGGIIIYPTDTVYGIGCSVYNKRAIEKIYKLKGMQKSDPASFICSDLSHASEFAEISNYAFRLMRRVLPGPYTFVLPGLRNVPKLMLARRKTVGIRIPDAPIPLKIVESLGHPIVTTSAVDRSGEVMCDPYELDDIYRNEVEMVIDGGLLGIIPSTVIDFTEPEPVILREGKGDVSLFE